MKKIIIFGATGNVGSYVHKYACEYFNGKYEVIASGRRETDFFERQGQKYVSVDMMKSEDFNKLPQDDVYAVIDLAAQIPSYMKGYQPEKYVQSNIIGAYNTLEYCRKVHADRILFSTTVFDISLSAMDGTVLTPYLPYNFSYKGDHAVYVITKNTAIEFIKHYHEEYGLKYFIFRFPTIYNYSPYHYYHPNGVKTLRPVYRMIDQAMKGEPIELWGDPNYSKDMVHVYDCAQMICKAVEVNRDHSWYNVGTGIPVTLKEQIETIIKVFSPEDNPSTIIYRPDKKAGGGFLMDVTNAKEELGYEPKYDVEALFRNYKEEMEINRFKDLRGGGVIFKNSEVNEDKNMRTALVTSTGSVATDITLKSLKKMGFRVIGCNIYPKEWVVESCEMDDFYQVPYVSDKENYLNSIRELCIRENVKYVLPMIDYEIDLLCQHREWFENRGIVLCFSPNKALEIIRNKKKLADFIERECPEINPIPTVMLKDVEKLEWNFPVVCKPYNGRSSQGLRYIHNMLEWNEFSTIADKETYIVEPFIKGPIVMVEIVRQSNPHKVIAMSRKELISTPHGCSLAVLIFQDEKLEEASRILADKLGVLGDVNFEYILGEDGRYYFVECNPRFSAGCEFSCIGGYNYVENHMRCFMGMEIEDANFRNNMIISRKYEEYVTASNVNVEDFL